MPEFGILVPLRIRRQSTQPAVQLFTRGIGDLGWDQMTKVRMAMPLGIVRQTAKVAVQFLSSCNFDWFSGLQTGANKKGPD